MKRILSTIFLYLMVNNLFADELPNKAPRPGAPSVTSPISVVVPSIDLGAIQQILASINCKIGNVDQDVCEDTILSVLGDACTILGISISEALSILLDCCETSTLDISEIFTVLQDIKDTITECCSTMTEDFQFTWTILADLNDTITDCCSTMTEDFQFTWTILADLNDTITDCCSTMTEDFQFTWTILADLNDTITTDFQDTWTILAECCSTMTTDFQNTWTILAELLGTLTDCCSTMTTDFQFTWTILADLKDTLTNCGMPTPITQELIPYTITEPGLYCLAEDVTVTGTGIIIESDNVILDLNEHQIIGGLVGISVLSEENVIIKNGIVRDQTESNISVDTPTTIQNLLIQDNQLLNATTNSLQVFSIFRDIIVQNCIIKSLVATGIEVNPVDDEATARGFFVDNCFLDTGNIGININPLTSILLTNIKNCDIQAVNNGITVSQAIQVSIVESTIQRCLDGISIINASTEVLIDNCAIILNTGTGIFTSAPETNIINSIIADNSVGGINLGTLISSSINSSVINCTILNNTGFGITIDNGGSNTIKDCDIKNSTAGDGITINSSNTIVDNCSLTTNGISVNNVASAVMIKDCEIAASPSQGILVTNGSNITIANCSVSTSGSAGIQVDSPSGIISIRQCEISGNTGTGISMDGFSCVIEDCSSINNLSLGITILENGSFATVINCRLIANTSHGISLNGTGSQVLNCSAIGNGGSGFLVSATGTISEVINNVANFNGLFGFDNAGGATNKFYKNFGTSNGSGNYSAGVPATLVYTPATVLAGTFSDIIGNTDD